MNKHDRTSAERATLNLYVIWNDDVRKSSINKELGKEFLDIPEVLNDGAKWYDCADAASTVPTGGEAEVRPTWGVKQE